MRQSGVIVRKNSTRWTLPENEVTSGMTGASSSSRGGRVARTSRKRNLTSLTFRLCHQPTGISVSARIPTGHYSRKEMLAERERLRTELWGELEEKVARHLRVPGR